MKFVFDFRNIEIYRTNYGNYSTNQNEANKTSDKLLDLLKKAGTSRFSFFAIDVKFAMDNLIRDCEANSIFPYAILVL